MANAQLYRQFWVRTSKMAKSTSNIVVIPRAIFSCNSVLWQYNWSIFLGFFFLVLLLRSSSFFVSALNVDESIYLLMSQSILDGNVPYTEIWDHKPPGIYILFSIAQVLFGRSVLAIRILSCLSVSATSFLLFRLGEAIHEKGRKLGLLAGTLYAVFSLNSGGLAANMEIFFRH